jgi:hypothetical protein
VKFLVKSFVVWFLLLAVPFQGFASATMLFCAPIQAPASRMQAAAADHDHAAMMAEHHGAGHQAAMTDDASDQAADPASAQHDGGKCTTCAACCVGASMAPSQPIGLAAGTPHRVTAPFVPAFIPAVERSLLERPPQGSLT